MLRNLYIKKVGNDLHQVNIGVINFQVTKKELELLSLLCAKALDQQVVDDEDLKGIFQRYEKLDIKTPTLVIPYHGKANANSTKEKPLGG